MTVSGTPLGIAHRRLVGEELTGEFEIARREDVERQRQRRGDAVVEIADLGQTLRREGIALADLLLGELAQVLVDDVADMLEIGDQGDDLEQAPALLLGQFVAGDLDQIELDRLVDGVDAVISLGDGSGELEFVLLQQRHGIAQHALDAVAEAQSLAHRPRQRLGRAVERVRVEIARRHGLRLLLLAGHEALDQRRDRTDEGQEDQRADDVEHDVEFDREPCIRRGQADEPGRKRADEGQHGKRQDQARDEIADSGAPLGGGRAELVEHRDQRIAEIGTDDQRQRRRGREQAGCREGGDKQDDRDRGMHNPGRGDGREDAEQRLRAHGREDEAEGRRLRERRGGGIEFDQREQDQADTDQHAADIARALHRLAGEIQRDADGDAEPPEPAEIHRDDEGRERRAEIGAEQHRERHRRHDQRLTGEGGDEQCRRRRALQHHGHGDAAAEGGEAIARETLQRLPELRAEGAHRAGSHQPDRPDQQRDAADEMDQDGGCALARGHFRVVFPDSGDDRQPNLSIFD